MEEFTPRKSRSDAFPKLVEYTRNDLSTWVNSAVRIALEQDILTRDQLDKSFDETEKSGLRGLPQIYRTPFYQLLKTTDPGGILRSIGFFNFFENGKHFEYLTGRLIRGENVRYGTVLSQISVNYWTGWADLALFPESFDTKECTYLRFLQTVPNELGVLEFANQFGFLGGSFTFWEAEEKEGNSFYIFNSSYAEGEFLDDWLSEISLMKDHFLLWKAIKENNLEFMQRYLVDGEGKGTTFFLSPTTVNKKYLDFPWGFLSHKKISIDNLEFCAKSMLQEVFCNRVNLSSPILELKKNKFQIDFTSDSLIAKLWLEFAKAVASDSEIRTCDECGNFFSVGQKKNSRKDKKYCDSRCRGRNFAKNRRRVL